MMHSKGLTKLMEECGELTQACAKKAAFLDTDEHPDGLDMKLRLEEEIADVVAACEFVREKLNLRMDFIKVRAHFKNSLFQEWDSQP